MTILIFVTWYLIGIASFIFWWSREFKLIKEDYFISLIAGICGPVGWIYGYLTHGECSNVNFFGIKK